MKLGPHRHTLDRGNLVSLHRHPKSQTRKHRTAIHQHRTTSTFAQFTAVLRARQPKVLAKYLQQRLVRREGDFRLFAIDPQTDMHFFELFSAVLAQWLHKLCLIRTIWQPP